MKVYLILFSIVFIFSCSKRKTGTGNEIVNYMFSGTIVDCNDDPIVGAELSLNNYDDISTQTNENGEWTLVTNNVVACDNDTCKINITYLRVDEATNSSFTAYNFELNEEGTYVKTGITKNFNTEDNEFSNNVCSEQGQVDPDPPAGE